MNWRSPAHVLAFGFGSGLSPIAPGTAGSILAALVYWFLLAPLPLGWIVAVIIAGTAAANPEFTADNQRLLHAMGDRPQRSRDCCPEGAA